MEYRKKGSIPQEITSFTHHYKEKPMTTIHIQAFIHKELAQVWEAYTHPQHIIHWNFANSQWHCPQATNDLRIGGRLSLIHI